MVPSQAPGVTTWRPDYPRRRRGLRNVRAEGLEPSRACAQRIFVPSTAFAAPPAWAGLRSGLSLHRAPDLILGLGAARLVSTPSRLECSGRAWLGIAITGFPEFEQFCIVGFPASTQVFAQVRCVCHSATPACPLRNRPQSYGCGGQVAKDTRVEGLPRLLFEVPIWHLKDPASSSRGARKGCVSRRADGYSRCGSSSAGKAASGVSGPSRTGRRSGDRVPAPCAPGRGWRRESHGL